MNGNELMRKLRKYAKARGLDLGLVAHRGKGSHGTLYLGSRRTTLKDRKKEISPGLLNSMLKDLGIDPKDI
ncbi:type II toxin-antitoxin system HicA family toxin [Thalassospira australica]|uniref:type II toxin-antitoxin system HicA family toxin n=1 Tax=Thalassospira australica TaxID=1528106 RepID=UPI00051A2003|nr:type II toxin-antitoxin system HicA family toxin [Thalassospira australica]